MKEQSGGPVGAGGLIQPRETLTPLHKVLPTVARVHSELDERGPFITDTCCSDTDT